MQESVKCEECGNEFKCITVQHLMKFHNLSMAEYREKYPEAKLSISRKKVIEPIILEDNIFLDNSFPEFSIKKSNINIKDNSNFINSTINKSCFSAKEELIKQLNKYFNIIDNYIIELRDKQNEIIFMIHTDMADPIRKIDFEFPDSFWHNKELIGLDRKKELKNLGWKIIEVNGVNPDINVILELIKNS